MCIVQCSLESVHERTSGSSKKKTLVLVALSQLLLFGVNDSVSERYAGAAPRQCTCKWLKQASWDATPSFTRAKRRPTQNWLLVWVATVVELKWPVSPFGHRDSELILKRTQSGGIEHCRAVKAPNSLAQLGASRAL